MKKKLFILTNKKQLLGAKLSEYSFQKHVKSDPDISIEIVVIDDLHQFRELEGQTYLRRGKPITYTLNDLQSFTLARFFPPECMRFEGRAVAIDPDIFALKDVSALFSMNLEGNRLAATWKPAKRIWDTSVMVFDCEKLTHWKFDELLERLFAKEIDYTDLMHLTIEKEVLPLDRIWNSLDHMDERTRILHTTNRITQPWKTGLPIDFTLKPLPKMFGLIPREPLQKLLGTYPTHYKKHPDQKIEQWFLELVQEALTAGALNESFLKHEVGRGHIRSDIFDMLSSLRETA